MSFERMLINGKYDLSCIVSTKLLPHPPFHGVLRDAFLITNTPNLSPRAPHPCLRIPYPNNHGTVHALSVEFLRRRDVWSTQSNHNDIIISSLQVTVWKNLHITNHLEVTKAKWLAYHSTTHRASRACSPLLFSTGFGRNCPRPQRIPITS